MDQPARRQMRSFLISEKLKGLGATRSSKAARSEPVFLAGTRQWQTIYADRLERIISCYQTPEEQIHANRLSRATSLIVEELKNEVTKHGVDWHRIAPPRPVGVDSGGIVLAWDEPTWGAEIEIEIPADGGPAEVFVWADFKAHSNEADIGDASSEESEEENQDVYYQRLIRLLCRKTVS